MSTTILAPSSPLSSPLPSQSFTRGTPASQESPQYRPGVQLPFELVQHVQTYLEEGLFTQAFKFLLSISSNSASSSDRRAPVTVPPASHLALACTIAVHPSMTTRTNEREKWNQANAALRLLKLIHTLVGPVDARFSTAFAFRKFDFHYSRSNDREDDDDEGDTENESGRAELNTTYARSNSLWTRAEDFWQLVGWAFNCACLPGIHLARWNQYRLLLEFLLVVLEEDWQVRTRGDDASPEESLLWQYIELSSGGHTRQRKILRAVFADGSARSMSEFREIFAHELKEPEQEEGTVKKLEKQDHVDIDREVYGDYLAQEDDDVSDGVGGDGDAMSTGSGRPAKRPRRRTQTPSSKGLTPRSSVGSFRSAYTTDGEGDANNSSLPALGDHATIHLRLGLLRLLTWVSSHETLTSTSPTTFPDLEDLLLLFVEFIRPLPLAVFAQFVMPSPSNPFEPTTLTNLCEAILQRTLEQSAPSQRSLVLLSQEKLELEYFPFAASKHSIDANARVSILLESLMRTLAGMGAMKASDKLKILAAEGIERRLRKVADQAEKKAGKKGKKQPEEAVAWQWLIESGERITAMVNGLEKKLGGKHD